MCSFSLRCYQSAAMSAKMIIQPYSLKELSGTYNVSKNTFKKWLKTFEEELGDRKGYYYSNAQVKLIFEKLGHPEAKQGKGK